MKCEVCGHRPHPGFQCNIPEPPDFHACECPFSTQVSVSVQSSIFDHAPAQPSELELLREEVARLREENQRLLGNPSENTVGKFTTGRTGSPESKAAAYAVLPRTGTKRAHVLDLITMRYPNGFSDEDIQNLTGYDIRSVNARRKELEEGGWVMKADWTKLAKSGTHVSVWKLSPTGADRLGIA